MAVNFGIIGYSRIAEVAHKPLMAATRGANLLAVADITEARRKAALDQGIPRAYATVAGLLKDPDVDAVVICTPSHSHCKLAIQAAKAGKHVIIEKPASLNAADLRKTIAAVRKLGVQMTVFHNRRFDPDFMACQQVVNRKMVGDLISIEMRWEMYGNGVTFGVKEYNPGWRAMKRFGGGVLLDLGVHMLDQLVHLAPGKPKQVFANVRGGVHDGDCDDLASGMIRFDDGVMATMEVNSLLKYKLPRYRILGSKGVAVINTETKCIDVYVGDTATPTRSVSYDKPRKWNTIYRSFIDVIEGKKKELAVTPESVLLTMELVDAYRASSRAGRSVGVDGK